MIITVDTDKDSPPVIANVAKFLLMGYGTPAEIGALVTASLKPTEAPTPPAPDFAPSDDMPPSPIELGKDAADTKAASVFGGAVPVPPAPLAPAPVPPPVVTPAPVAPVAAVSTPVPAGVEVDSAGVPHDPALHAANKAKKQDGTWKAKKGNAAAAPVPPVPTAPAAAAAPVPPAPPAGSLPSVPGGPVQGPVTFREVMRKVTEGQSSGKLSKLQVDTALGAVGFKPDELAPLVMPANVELLKAFNQLIDAELAKVA